MKIFLTMIITALIAGCYSNSSDKSFSSVESNIRLEENLISDEIRSSWGRQADFFSEGNFTLLSWNDAQSLLREESYRGGKQYHTGWLTIYTVDDQSFLTKQPKLDDFFEFMKKNGLSTKGFGTE